MVRKTTCALIIIIVLLLICFIAYVCKDHRHRLPLVERIPLPNVTESTELENESENKLEDELEKSKNPILTDENFIKDEHNYHDHLMDGCMRASKNYDTMFVIIREFIIRNDLPGYLKNSKIIDYFEQHIFSWNPIFQIDCTGNTREREFNDHFTSLMSNCKFLSIFDFDDKKTDEIIKMHNAYAKFKNDNPERRFGKLTDVCPLFRQMNNFVYNDGTMDIEYIKASCKLTKQILNDFRKDYFDDFVVVETIASILRKYEPAITSDEVTKKKECERLTTRSSKVFLDSFREKWQLDQFDKKISDFYEKALNTTLELEASLNQNTSEKMKNIILLKPWVKKDCKKGKVFDPYVFAKFYKMYGNFIADTYTLQLYNARYHCHENCQNDYNFMNLAKFDGNQTMFISPYFMKSHGILERNAFLPEQIISLSYVLGDELCYALKYYDTTNSQSNNTLRPVKLDDECIEKRQPFAKRLLEKYEFKVSNETFARIYMNMEKFIIETKKSFAGA